MFLNAHQKVFCFTGVKNFTYNTTDNRIYIVLYLGKKTKLEVLVYILPSSGTVKYRK